jgi:hypothetical protein
VSLDVIIESPHSSRAAACAASEAALAATIDPPLSKYPVRAASLMSNPVSECAINSLVSDVPLVDVYASGACVFCGDTHASAPTRETTPGRNGQPVCAGSEGEPTNVMFGSRIDHGSTA